MQNFLIKLLEPRTNGPEIALVLISQLNVRISRTTLTKEIEEHPNFPSLLSISDVLSTYGIENIGIKFDINKISTLPTPLVTQIEGVSNNILFFTVIKEIKKESVILYDPESHRWAEVSHLEFNERCSRIALLIDAEEAVGEPEYNINRKKERKKAMQTYAKILSVPLIVAISAVSTLMNYGINALLPVLYSIVTLVGAGISALLLFYEIDIHNPILQQICSAGKKVNCGNILRSKAASIFGMSWSSMGFSYFMGLLLLLLSGINNQITLYIVSWLNSVAVFYVIFSIYYQWRVAKQWCILCLYVQAVLIIQILIVNIGNWHQFSNFSIVASQSILPVISSFIIPLVIVSILLPALQKAKESKHNYTELQKLKHNHEVFETLLKKQKHLTENPDGMGILLGNKNATQKLIKVCNPYCGPCARAHKPMEELLENNSNLQIQILFTASNNDQDLKTAPVKHLLAIAEKNSETTLKAALDDWYLAENKDYDAFALKYPMNGDLQRQGVKIEKMRNWCDQASIAFTPMFFVSVKNDHDKDEYYQLPEIYNVSDLKYFFSS